MYRPISALLSQTLVALTIELDNEFERRIAQAGHPGARLSWVAWANAMRFLAAGPASVRDLARQSLLPEPRAKFQFGGLERWGFVALSDGTASEPVNALRDGFGSGRGVRANSIAHLTAKGRIACEIWRDLTDEIEQRWRVRFGEERFDSLRGTLASMVEGLDLELPQGLPLNLLRTPRYPRGTSRPARHMSFPALLSQLLLAFAGEFDQESLAPIQLCANTLRVLSETPVPERELPRLTGCSPETCGMGWQLKPYVTVASDPAAKRGKAIWLNARGIEVQLNYAQLTGEIENRWKHRFEASAVHDLRASLEQLFASRREGRPLLAEGLTPPEGSVRAGALSPALGRLAVGAAARQRMRDLVAQTEWFLADPAGALPHYPLWDHNRGYGP